MESYWQSPPSASSYYPTMPTPSTPYCYCCCSPSTYYHSTVTPSFTYTPPPLSFVPPTSQVSTPRLNTVETQSASNKITRLQYSNKDRYILNELFKRTPYPNGIQRDLIARQLGISQEQVRIWFQNRRRLQTQREAGERLATSNELTALQRGKANANNNDLRQLINDIAQYKDAPPRLRLDDSA